MSIYTSPCYCNQKEDTARTVGDEEVEGDHAVLGWDPEGKGHLVGEGVVGWIVSFIFCFSF